jgi:hypothetical protein
VTQIRQPEPLPEVPTTKLRFDVQQILRSRNRLMDSLLCEFEGRVIRGSAEVGRLVAIVATTLRLRLSDELLLPSLTDLIGVTITRKKVKAAAWRLAGNVERLRSHWIVPMWTAQKLREWVPFEVLTCKLTRRHTGGDMGAQFEFVALAGTPAGLTYQSWWSLRLCRYRAPLFSFSRPPSPRARTAPKYPFSSPLDFTAMRFVGLVEPHLSDRQVGPGFAEVEMPDNFRKANRELVRKRFRVDPGYDCPEGEPNTFACAKCPLGLESCLAATHRKDWRAAHCPGCDEDDQWFDDHLSKTLCIDCYYKRLKETR